MVRVAFGIPAAFRLSALAMVGTMGVLAISTDPADARSRRGRGKPSSAIAKSVSKGAAQVASRGSYSPPYAAIVVDANSGKALHEANPDALRHPASLTKIMTLYLLFERLESGKMSLDSQMPVSAHAASQDPTKLGLRPGQTLAVEDAIKGLVTKSANDAAVVIGEAIAGDEDDFAELMTRKAHALGMSRTTYRNASGLPNDEQFTTARDQATLGRAIQERFPKYYRYFSTTSFTYRGNTMGNHNHLLGRVEGIDGIKTGYTRASGFNLVTSLKRDGRHLVSVVLGGASAGSRDARMKTLISQYVMEASLRRSAPMIAEAADDGRPTREPSRPARDVAVATAQIKEQAKDIGKSADIGGYQVASADVRVAPAPRPAGLQSAAVNTAPLPAVTRVDAGVAQVMKADVRSDLKPTIGSAEPIKPNAVRTVKVTFGGVQLASLAAPSSAARPTIDSAFASVQAAAPPSRYDVASASTVSAPAPSPRVSTRSESVALANLSGASVAKAAAKVETAASRTTAGGWIIQIGAFGGETEAKLKLAAAQSKARDLLGRAEARAEAASKGDKTFYRARFAGLGKEQAEAACKQLKHNDIACITIRN